MPCVKLTAYFACPLASLRLRKELLLLSDRFNSTAEGIDLQSLVIGSKLRLGAVAEIEITQLGQECHNQCEIFQQGGDCIMPREGVFAEVTKPGRIKTGDPIEILPATG
jgi:MOSC domain-containing protein YiiM